jgi:AcrR family transcriptional regulator
LSPEEERQRGLTRERLVEAALGLVDEGGLDALSMRALADRLEVKAASLYWHVRDRRELLELLAESILESVSHPRRGGGWRACVLAHGQALRRRVITHKDAAQILLEVPTALERSETFEAVKAELVGAGLPDAEAGDVALMVMTYVIAGRRPDMAPVTERAEPASVAIDTGSRGVVLRAGPPDMQVLIRVPPDQNAAAPAVIVQDAVVVRRLRGVGRGELELNPRRPWSFKVQAPTWNTMLDVAGLDVRRIHIDSGAAKVECFLPQPRGVVPIHISSGVANVALHRPRGAAAVAAISTGAVKVRLDDFSTGVTVSDVHWQSEAAAQAPDRYELQISSGAVKVSLDSYTAKATPVMPRQAQPDGKQASALEILLDGVEARIRSS